MNPDLPALGDEGSWEQFREMVYGASRRDVLRAIASDSLELPQLAALLSPAASGELEAMAQRASRVTLRRFGRVVVLYTPLYISNECANPCTYCGFAARRGTPRRTLTAEEIQQESSQLLDEGFGHVLLLTGEQPKLAPVSYIRDAVASCHGRFSSVGVEIYPLDEAGYAQLVGAGCDALTLYQETYHQPTYAAVHPGGPKADFHGRLAAPARAAAAGMRSVGIGALLGLADWRVEGMFLGQHGRGLKHRYWQSRLSIGFPRLRDEPGAGLALQSLSQRDLVQMITAMRIFFPDADLVLSTREDAAFRDGIVGLGITRMSAGSRTSPGGYSLEGSGDQFPVTDDRSPAQISEMIAGKGFEPVWKDWDREFLA